MKSNCDGNILSYICTAVLLIVLFSLPVVSFLASGFTIDVQGYGIKEQTEPISAFQGLNISSDVLSTLDVADTDIVVVAPSFYDTGLSVCTGFMPWLFAAVIVLTPLSELIQYLIMRRKGEMLELVVERSIMPMFLLMFTSLAGAISVQVAGYAATYAQNLSIDTISVNTSAILTFSVVVFSAVIIGIIVWAIPIIMKLVSSRKNEDIASEDESEFVNQDI